MLSLYLLINTFLFLVFIVKFFFFFSVEDDADCVTMEDDGTGEKGHGRLGVIDLVGWC